MTINRSIVRISGDRVKLTFAKSSLRISARRKIILEKSICKKKWKRFKLSSATLSSPNTWRRSQRFLVIVCLVYSSRVDVRLSIARGNERINARNLNRLNGDPGIIARKRYTMNVSKIRHRSFYRARLIVSRLEKRVVERHRRALFVGSSIDVSRI